MDMKDNLSLEHGSVDGVEASEWVKSRVKGLSKFLGVSCGGFEEEVTAMFSSIEKNRRANDVVSPRRKLVSPGERRKRELKKLEWTINYAGKEKSNVVARVVDGGGMVVLI